MLEGLVEDDPISDDEVDTSYEKVFPEKQKPNVKNKQYNDYLHQIAQFKSSPLYIELLRYADLTCKLKLLREDKELWAKIRYFKLEPIFTPRTLKQTLKRLMPYINEYKDLD